MSQVRVLTEARQPHGREPASCHPCSFRIAVSILPAQLADLLAAAVRAAPDLTAVFVLSARPGRRSERDGRARIIRDPSVRNEGLAIRRRRSAASVWCYQTVVLTRRGYLRMASTVF